MSLDALYRLQRELYLTAELDGTIHKCESVTRVFGLQNARKEYRWRSDVLEIVLDDFHGYLTATFAGRLVCSTYRLQQTFMPGDWLKIVERKYQEILELVG